MSQANKINEIEQAFKNKNPDIKKVRNLVWNLISEIHHLLPEETKEIDNLLITTKNQPQLKVLIRNPNFLISRLFGKIGTYHLIKVNTEKFESGGSEIISIQSEFLNPKKESFSIKLLMHKESNEISIHKKSIQSNLQAFPAQSFAQKDIVKILSALMCIRKSIQSQLTESGNSPSKSWEDSLFEESEFEESDQ